MDDAKYTAIVKQFAGVQAKAASEWGVFRRFLSAHPLTGFWIGTGAGAGAAIVARFFLV